MGNTFLKWAGGKHWFVNREWHRLPVNYNRYFEPFLGGGSVFFHLHPQNAVLSDINQELINTYTAIRDDVNNVYRNLKTHEKKHSKEYFYTVREKKPRTNASVAARMIYLNKACYNGIYRVNKAGKFNVPYGTADTVCFNKSNLSETSKDLKNATIICQDFELTIDMAQNNDFIFCDPPYTVLDDTNRFVGYNADVFSWEDQIRLANALRRAKDRNVKILMTNVDHNSVRALYDNIDGFLLESIERHCFISGTNEGRKKYKELIVMANL